MYLLSIVGVNVKPGGGCVAYKSQCCAVALTIAGSNDGQSQAEDEMKKKKKITINSICQMLTSY